MSRFAVFATEQCYPKGGWDDLYCLCDDKGEAFTKAKSAIRDGDFSRSHVVDLQACEEIADAHWFKGDVVFQEYELEG